jgi:hypothetical protein
VSVESFGSGQRFSSLRPHTLEDHSFIRLRICQALTVPEGVDMCIYEYIEDQSFIHLIICQALKVPEGEPIYLYTYVDRESGEREKTRESEGERAC